MGRTMQAKDQLLFAGKSPSADGFSSRYISLGPYLKLLPWLPAVATAAISLGHLVLIWTAVVPPGFVLSLLPMAQDTWSVTSSSSLSPPPSMANIGQTSNLKRPEPDRNLQLPVSWRNMEFSGSENTEGLSLSLLTSPLGSSIF